MAFLLEEFIIFVIVMILRIIVKFKGQFGAFKLPKESGVSFGFCDMMVLSHLKKYDLSRWSWKKII